MRYDAYDEVGGRGSWVIDRSGRRNRYPGHYGPGSERPEAGTHGLGVVNPQNITPSIKTPSNTTPTTTTPLREESSMTQRESDRKGTTYARKHATEQNRSSGGAQSTALSGLRSEWVWPLANY